jgi:hypothetical protein
MVSSRRRHFQRPLCRLLSLDVAQIWQLDVIGSDTRLGAGHHLCSFDVVYNLDQVLGRQDVHICSCPGGFGTRGFRTDEAKIASARCNCCRKRTRNTKDGTIKCQFAHDQIARQEIVWDDTEGRKQGQGDGQIEMAAFLGQIRRRKIDHDSFAWQCEANGVQGRAHSLAAFGHCLVW